MKSAAALTVFAGILLSATSIGAEPQGDAKIRAEAIVNAANGWQEGQEVPQELLMYKNSWISDIGIHPDGTDILFGRIKNYGLIKNIAFRTNVDNQVWEAAIYRALRVVGPTKFLNDANSNSTAPLRLKKQSLVKHVAGESLFVHFSDITEETAQNVLREIKDELGAGKPFAEVLGRYQRKYPDRGGRTKIGSGVDFILAANKDPLFSFPTEYIPKEHIDDLLRARLGEVLILPYKEDPNQVDVVGDGRGLILYQIREVYMPFSGL